MRYVLTAAITAVVCFAIAATTGIASRQGRTITFRNGDFLYVPSIQLDCSLTQVYGGVAVRSFDCTDGGPFPSGANVDWYRNRVEIETNATPTSVIRTYPSGKQYHVWRFRAVP